MCRPERRAEPAPRNAVCSGTGRRDSSSSRAGYSDLAGGVKPAGRRSALGAFAEKVARPGGSALWSPWPRPSRRGSPVTVRGAGRQSGPHGRLSTDVVAATAARVVLSPARVL